MSAMLNDDERQILIIALRRLLDQPEESLLPPRKAVENLLDRVRDPAFPSVVRLNTVDGNVIGGQVAQISGDTITGGVHFR